MDSSQPPAESVQPEQSGALEQAEQLQSLDPPEPTQPVESKTREYLSNERTYLAWMRTATSLMGIGVILARIHAVQTSLALGSGTAWRLGIIFAVVGLITVFLATEHYLAVRREIANHSAEVTERWVIVFSIAVILIGSGIVYYVLADTPYSASAG